MPLPLGVHQRIFLNLSMKVNLRNLPLIPWIALSLGLLNPMARNQKLLLRLPHLPNPKLLSLDIYGGIVDLLFVILELNSPFLCYVLYLFFFVNVFIVVTFPS